MPGKKFVIKPFRPNVQMDDKQATIRPLTPRPALARTKSPVLSDGSQLAAASSKKSVHAGLLRPLV